MKYENFEEVKYIANRIKELEREIFKLRQADEINIWVNEVTIELTPEQSQLLIETAVGMKLSEMSALKARLETL